MNLFFSIYVVNGQEDNSASLLPVTSLCLFPVMGCMDLRVKSLSRVATTKKQKCQLTIKSQALEASRLGNQGSKE